MRGSFSQVSMTAARRRPAWRASRRAPVATTSPRLVLKSTAVGFSRASRAASARWKVGWGSGAWVSGVWKVSTSARRATSSTGRKPSLPSRSARGGSQRRISPKPRRRAIASTACPTWPTPTMPSVRPAKTAGSKSAAGAVAARSGPPDQQPWTASWSSEASTYCATLRALQPGQLVQPMPACASHAASRWSKPMVAVAMN